MVSYAIGPVLRAAWVAGLDVNDAAVVGGVVAAVGLDRSRPLAAAMERGPGQMLEAAVAAFDRDGDPGVPVWGVDGVRCPGKDRVEWLAERVRERSAGS